jgi:hypothetical protein
LKGARESHFQYVLEGFLGLNIGAAGKLDDPESQEVPVAKARSRSFGDNMVM